MKHRFKNLLSRGAHYVCPWKSKEVSSNSTCGRAAIACFPTAEPPALTSDTSLENIFISHTSFLKCTVVIRMINTHGCFLCLFILFEVHPAPWIVMICEFYKCLGKKKNPRSRDVSSACLAPVSYSPFHVVLRPLILESPILWADMRLCGFLGCYRVFQQELMCPLSAHSQEDRKSVV